MKLLLVALNAKYIHSNLAVYSLQSYAKKYGKHIGLAEFTINHSEEDILKKIYQEQAEVIAFSCYIWNIEIVTRIVKELKKVQPKAQIWFGGPEVSYDAKERLMLIQELEGVIIGEGEQTFLELVQYFVEGTNKLEEINGLAFRKEADVIITPNRQPLSLDVIPFPYEHIENFQNRIIYYESSRGCPFSCSYCLSSIDKKVRLRNTELVKAELKLFLDYRIPQVKFVDRTFNCNKKHAMEIWRFIQENDNGITNFHFEISADLLEEEEIEFLASLRPGQIQFEIGVQTTNPDTVGAIHRSMDLDRLSRNVARIKESRNLHQHLDLIAGLPLEDYKSFEQSFNQVYRMKPDQLQLGFLKVLKGSLMEEENKRYGIIYRSTPPYEVLYTDVLSYEDMLRIKGICEMVEIYYNSGQFAYSMKYLEHFYESPMMLYQSIYHYYENKDIELIAHSRIRRYEILLNFYIEQVLKDALSEEETEQKEVFAEILLLDLFLREDMKSRPGFAPTRTNHTSLRDIYEKYRKEQKAVHIEKFHYDVISSAQSGKAVKKRMMLLFDYSSRDPLSKSAKLEILEVVS